MRSQRTSRSALSLDHLVLGRAARELRARRGLTQEDLGALSGLHRNYVGAIERGEVNATFATLLRLCGGLDMPLSTLVYTYEDRRADRAEGR